MTLKDKCLITYPKKMVKRDKDHGLSHQFRLVLHQQGFDNRTTVNISQPFGSSPLGMGHHTKYIALAVADTRDIAQGAVGVGGIGDSARGIAVAVNHLVA